MAEEKPPFPPLSTSLDDFLDDGSDQRFRQLINNLLRMSSAMLATRERYAELIGVSPPQYSILMAVADAGTTTVSQIASYLEVSGPFVTLQVKQMAEAGLLGRAPHPEDGRSTLLFLTEKGRELVLKVSPTRKSANDTIFGAFPGEDAQRLEATIEALLRQLRQALHELDRPAGSA